MDGANRLFYFAGLPLDLHQVRNEWENMMPTVIPACPVMKSWGRVVKGRERSQEVQAGDLAAVGCMVDPTASVRTLSRG